MAEILITGMDLSEDRQIIITKDGQVLATDWRGISMPTEATARELPPHGDLIDESKLPIKIITDYKLKPYVVVEIEDIEKAPAVIEASKERE